MKRLIPLALLALLTGCAAQQKSDGEIYRAAAVQLASTLPAGQTSMSLPGMKILSHGLLADSIAISVGGGATARQLQQALLAAKKSGEAGFLIMGSNSALDLAVIQRAVDSQDLSGMRIFYSGDIAREHEIRSVIEKTQADFHYINAK